MSYVYEPGTWWGVGRGGASVRRHAAAEGGEGCKECKECKGYETQQRGRLRRPPRAMPQSVAGPSIRSLLLCSNGLFWRSCHMVDFPAVPGFQVHFIVAH